MSQKTPEHQCSKEERELFNKYGFCDLEIKEFKETFNMIDAD